MFRIIVGCLTVAWIVGAQFFYERHVNELEATIKKQQSQINDLLDEVESYRE